MGKTKWLELWKLSFFILCVWAVKPVTQKDPLKSWQGFNNSNTSVQRCSETRLKSGTNTWCLSSGRHFRPFMTSQRATHSHVSRQMKQVKEGALGFSLHCLSHVLHFPPETLEISKTWSSWKSRRTFPCKVFSTSSDRGTQIPPIRKILLAANHCQWEWVGRAALPLHFPSSSGRMVPLYWSAAFLRHTTKLHSLNNSLSRPGHFQFQCFVFVPLV